MHAQGHGICFRLQTDHALPPLGRMLNGIADQVLQQHIHAMRIGKKLPVFLPGRLQRQLLMAAQRQRRQFCELLAHPHQHIDGLQVQFGGAWLESRQGQELLHHAGGAQHTVVELFQGFAPIGGIRRLGRVMDLDTQHRQRGSQLVRGIRQEAPFPGQ